MSNWICFDNAWSYSSLCLCTSSSCLDLISSSCDIIYIAFLFWINLVQELWQFWFILICNKPEHCFTFSLLRVASFLLIQEAYTSSFNKMLSSHLLSLSPYENMKTVLNSTCIRESRWVKYSWFYCTKHKFLYIFISLYH